MNKEVLNNNQNNSYDEENIELLHNIGIGNVTLRNLNNVKSLTLGMRINVVEGEFTTWGTSYYPSVDKLETYDDFELVVVNCPNLEEFNLKTNYGRTFYPNICDKLYAPSCKKDPTRYIPCFLLSICISSIVDGRARHLI